MTKYAWISLISYLIFLKLNARKFFWRADSKEVNYLFIHEGSKYRGVTKTESKCYKLKKSINCKKKPRAVFATKLKS